MPNPELTPDQRARLDAWHAEQAALRVVKEEMYAAMQKPWHVRLWGWCTNVFEGLAILVLSFAALACIAGLFCGAFGLFLFCIRAGWRAAGALL